MKSDLQKIIERAGSLERISDAMIKIVKEKSVHDEHLWAARTVIKLATALEKYENVVYESSRKGPVWAARDALKEAAGGEEL